MLGDDTPQAANDPVANAIVEGAKNQTMDLVTNHVKSTVCAVGVCHRVAQDPVEAFLGGEEVVQHSKKEAAITRVKPWRTTEWPDCFPLEVRVESFSS